MKPPLAGLAAGIALACPLSRLPAAPPVDGVVGFNELMYHPTDPSEQGEWIEVQSLMGVRVDLSGWRLSGGVDFTFPDGTVIAGDGRLVIARNPGLSGLAGALGPWTGALENSGETVRLENNSGRLMDQIDYRDEDEWPVGPDGSGSTLAKRAPRLASSAAGSWRTSAQAGGTPDAANFPGPITTRPVPFDAAWKYLTTGANPGSGWKERVFNDAAWPGGQGGFSVGGIGAHRPGGTGAPQPVRGPIKTLFATGMTADGSLLAPGTAEPHYIATGGGPAALVQIGHPAWMGADGLSQWIGRTATGTDNVPAESLTYRTTFDLTGSDPASAVVKVFTSVDNSLVSVAVNGVGVPGASGGSFTSYLGPITLPGPFVAGINTLDFTWNNAGGTPNPAGFRARYDATVPVTLALTALPANPRTSYFRRTFVVGGRVGSSYTLQFEHVTDDGLVAWLNGTEIHRWNMPPGPVTADTPALAPVQYPQFSGSLTLPGSAILPGENTLAVELHQAAAPDPDAYFGATLDVTEIAPDIDSLGVRLSEVAAATGDPVFLELHNAGTAPVDLAGYVLRSSTGDSHVFAAASSVPPDGRTTWLDTAWGHRLAPGEKIFLLSPMDSLVDAIEVAAHPQARDATGSWRVPSAQTPGTANAFALSDAIVINEILYHHAPEPLATGVIEDPEEWVELHNRSAQTVTMTGWKLRGGADYDFPNGTALPPGGYLVVAGNKAALQARYPAVAILGDWSGSLSNAGDTVRLEDSSGNAVDELRYLDRGRWDARADGGGSSLELKHPRMDNTLAESWAPSDEGGKSAWTTIDYTATGAPPAGSNDPTQYHEFILGLLDSGEVLIDDVSVQEVNQANRELVQNGNFAGNSVAKWRLLGNHGGHGRTVVAPDPANPADPVLRLVATGPAEHMHNHLETTMKAGGVFVPLSTASTYRIRLRARWLSGSPRLQTRLYFNRAARQHLLPIPVRNGTPGASNSRSVALPAPAVWELTHTPPVPAVNQPVVVSVKAQATGGLGSVRLFWRRDGAGWSQLVMTDAGSGVFTATLPGQGAGQLVQFYAEAVGSNGAPSTFPGAGAASRALVKWADGTLVTTPGHTFRILLPASDAGFLHSATNVMSNDSVPCTVVYRDEEIFYDTAVSLRSSQRGRLSDRRVGFAVDFDPTHLFRGAHRTVNLDRSSIGRGSEGSDATGTFGTGFGQNECLNWLVLNRAGGIPSLINDLVYALPPRPEHNGSAALTMAEFNDAFLDGQFRNGGDGPTFKYELIYFPISTSDGTPEGLKVANPDDVRGVSIGSINTPTNKESYRWNFIIGNARNQDDYSRLIAFNQALRLSGTAFATAIAAALDVDQYLRASAAMTLCGVVDHYSDGAQHNLKLYARPEDGRILYLPWDHDFLSAATDAALVRQGDLQKILSARPEWERAFYGHLHDLLTTSVNTAYLAPWTSHYQTFLTHGQKLIDVQNYLTTRAVTARQQCTTLFGSSLAFAITTNGGNPITTSNPTASLNGSAWVDVRTIRIAGADVPLPVTWPSRSGWQVTVPVAPGENVVTLEALDYRGLPIGSDTITITGTGALDPASFSNVVVTKLHYHPSAVTAAETAAGVVEEDDFEYLELQNIGPHPVSMAGCRFLGGLDYVFAAGAPLASGARLVVPRKAAAFALRHPGVATAPEYQQASGNKLDNAGEEIALIDAAGVDIKRFTYDDKSPWPVAADGGGPCLVLVAPAANPDHGLSINWRASLDADGRPGSSDALPPPGNPLADDNGNGLSNLVDYALGAGALPSIDPATGAIVIERESLADAVLDPNWSDDLVTWRPLGGEALERTPLGGTRERLSFARPAAALGSHFFVRTWVRLDP